MFRRMTLASEQGPTTSKIDLRLDEARSGQCAPGRLFIEQFMQPFDLSKLAYLKLAPGTPRGVGVYGVCRYPDKHGKTELTRTKYRISCFFTGPYPHMLWVRRRPIYRNENGSWPTIPKQLFLRGVTTHGSPPARAWQQLVAVNPLMDDSEALVWIAAHELFHFLRHTRQIAGRNTEVEADIFADETLEQFRYPGDRGRRTRDLSNSGGSSA